MEKVKVIEALEYCAKAYNDDLDGWTPIYNRDTDTQLIWKVKKGELYIVYRGTESIKDWMIDFLFLPIFHGVDCGIHSGAMIAYESVINDNDLQSEIVQAEHITVAGYSLGGALAIVTAHELACKVSTKITCITFGAYRVYTHISKALTEFLKSAVNYLNYVNGGDIVTKLPPWNKKNPGTIQLGKKKFLSCKDHYFSEYKKAVKCL